MELQAFIQQTESNLNKFGIGSIRELTNPSFIVREKHLICEDIDVNEMMEALKKTPLDIKKLNNNPEIIEQFLKLMILTVISEFEAVHNNISAISEKMTFQNIADLKVATDSVIRLRLQDVCYTSEIESVSYQLRKAIERVKSDLRLGLNVFAELPDSAIKAFFSGVRSNALWEKSREVQYDMCAYLQGICALLQFEKDYSNPKLFKYMVSEIYKDMEEISDSRGLEKFEECMKEELKFSPRRVVERQCAAIEILERLSGGN